ncbi:MAG: FtsX-like permease family protein [Actinobacteria bacterium]|nr:FtsX-like permease family protein [Actinomycetota bacterium]MBI3687763.1 FtsX-like permease family protein [Actinomycetota bacterium]
MSRLRLRKLARDVWLARTRVTMMIVAIAVSIVAVGAFLGSRSILMREVGVNYAETHPASATLVLPGGVGPEVLATARAQAGVTAVAARGSVQARIQRADGRWMPLVVFVSDRTDPRTMATNRVEVGSWPPPTDGFMLERTALPFLGLKAGDRVQLQTPSGVPTPITVSGVVHDGSVAPAEQERTAYGFLTTDAFHRLGEPTTLTELKIVVGDAAGPSGSRDRVTAVAQQLGATLTAQGHPVASIQIPPPLRHPHQGQMNTVGFLMLTFGAAALLLSSILVATMLGGMLAGQVRQLGAMKAIGARTGQLLGMYLLLTAVIASVATALAVVPGMLIGRTLAGFGGRMLNLDLTSRAIPSWVIVVEVLAGVGVPLLVALVPLVRASRITVREAIDDHGVDRETVGASGLDRLLARVGGTNRALLMALRNTVRRRGRFALTVGLLGIAGGLFLTGLNTATGWTGMVDNGIGVRHYDMEVRLNEAQPADRVRELLAAVPGVRTVGAWGSEPVTVHRDGAIDVAHVYPDDAHGSFTMIAPPADTPLISLPLKSGRWLRPDDTGAVVLNNLVPPLQAPGTKVGDDITLTVSGAPKTLRVVGIAADFGTQGTAYVTDREYAALTGHPGQVRMLRIVTGSHDAASRVVTLNAVERALSAQHITMESTFPLDELQSGLDRHVLVLADALIALSGILAVVALLGLASTMSTSVTERTREFGILHTIGATADRVRSLVVTEGMLIGATSIVLAGWFALPATRVLGSYIGMQAFASPLPYRFSFPALAGWVVAALLGAAGASAAAARRAARLTVREALSTL